VTPTPLRSLCDSLNDERDTGGQTRLARLLGWHHSTFWRKLNGKSRITPSDEFAIMKALEDTMRRPEGRLHASIGRKPKCRAIPPLTQK
jgi:hypothetical protein